MGTQGGWLSLALVWCVPGLLNLSTDFTSQYLNDNDKRFWQPTVLYKPLMKTTTWLSNCLALSFKYRLVKSIGRFNMSSSNHKGYVLCKQCCEQFGLRWLAVDTTYLGVMNFAHTYVVIWYENVKMGHLYTIPSVGN